MKRNTLIHKKGRTSILPTFFQALLWLCLLAVSFTVHGQKDSVLVISGTVYDATTKLPVAAALVRSLNYGSSTTSDENGAFKIELLSATDAVLVTAFDYSARAVAIRGNMVLAIDLYPEIFKSGHRELENLTGNKEAIYNTNSVDGFDGPESSNSPSIDAQMQALNGGSVHSTARSGLSGMGSSYFIRGFNSLNTNAQPLFVVDGVIWNSLSNVNSLHHGYFGNLLDDIDPVDVESVTVVKDGASIYGSKGANGVVIVKTKRGEGMATKIAVNAYTGVTLQPESLPMMDGEEFRIYASNLYSTMGYTNSEITNLPFLDLDKSANNYKIFNNKTKWDDRVYQTGVSKAINVAVNGGDERALYAFSFGYGSDIGVVKTTDRQRLNMRFNADFTLSKMFTMGLNIGFSNVDRNLLDDGVGSYTSPTYTAMIKAPFFSSYKYTSSGWAKSYDSFDYFKVSNPDGLIDKALNTTRHYRLNIGLKPTAKLTPYLTISTLFDYNLDKVKENYFSPIDYVAPRYLSGYGLSVNMARNQVMRNVALFDETQLEYKRTFNRVHRLNALLGWRYSTNYYELDYLDGHNSRSNDKPNVKDAPDFRSFYGINDRSHSVSNYGNIDYSYDNRYFLNAAMAIDGSSLFGRETKGGFQLFDYSWGVFPSVNAAWLVSSEEFMSGAKFVDLLKLRAGYGLSGNDGIQAYSNTTYFVTELLEATRIVSLVLGNLANNEVQWETTAKVNVGLDANLFNERVLLSVDAYLNKTNDLLMLRDLPAVAGKGKYWINDGKMSNKGLEVSALVKLLNTNNLKWEMCAKVGKYINSIESLPGGSYLTEAFGAEILTAVGNPAGVFYGYKTKGVLNTAAAATAANLKKENADGTYSYFAPGDMFFDDYKSDGIIDEGDRQVIGDPNPDFYGSFNSKWGYKRFTLDALFSFSYGNDVYNYLRANLESGSQLINQTSAMLNRWTYEGQQTDMPRSFSGDPMGNARFSDRWIEDGSYLKLKSVSLNFKVPYQSNMVSGINVWVSANNLFTFTRYLGRDPEVSSSNAVLLQGIDTGLLPQTPSFFVGVKLNL